MDLKTREESVVLKLDCSEFQNILTEEVKELKDLFDKYEHEIRIAGGAVRDLLLGRSPTDIDFATTATPEEMIEIFNTENIRMVNMGGEKHGTITPRINNKENFEVTTLRIDKVTDGRHSEVEFTTDWKVDASRRDFTINSMFLGFDGSVYDYFYGYDDLKNRRIVFVGDPEVRIQEDYLRILRYFRFFGKISEKVDNHEESTLEVIKNNAEGLTKIAGERIWVELKKTLEGPFAGNLLKTIMHLGIGKYIGIPTPNIEELNKLIKRSSTLCLNPITYLAALMYNIDNVTTLFNRIRFSNYERDMCYFIVENRDDKIGSRVLLPYEKLVLNSKVKETQIVDYVCEVLKYRGDNDLLNQFNQWNIPKFPVNGCTLKENGVPPGTMYTPIMNKLKDIWIENEYKQSKEDLIKLIPSILEGNLFLK